MADPRLTRWADCLVNYSAKVEPGNTVAISGHLAAEPLLREIAKKVIDVGGFPVVMPIIEGITPHLLSAGSDDQIRFLTPLEQFQRREADVSIHVMAETNTRRLNQVDVDKQQMFTAARNELGATFMRREAEGTLKWTLTLFPTNAYAQDADMETDAFEDFVMHSMKLDQDDPVAAWQELSREQQRLIDWLEGKEEIHLTSPDTDLTLSVAGRIWENSDGRKNFPSGEIFTGPIEDSANGHVRFSFPVVTAGRKIEDIRLTFRDGKIVDATAAKNEAFLISQLDTDEGARYLGEFAFGTNYDIQAFSSNILFDEKIGGTVHMAAGRGYPGTGSKNESSIHWDMICDLRSGGQVTVDGELFQQDGTFVI